MIKDRNIADNAMIQVHKILGSAGLFLTGEMFWVGTAGTQTYLAMQQKVQGDHLFTSVDTAVGSCVAGRGDLIVLMSEYAGTVTGAAGLVFDAANVKVLFLGSGDDKAKITFGSAVGADMDISANNITLINPKFVAGLDSLTGPIDVGATDFTIINGEYYDASNIETIDCIVADNTCARLKIDGWKFHSVTETADLKQSNILVDGVDGVILKNIDIRGDFEQGCIENSGDECLQMTLKDIYCRNLSDNPEPAILLDANCSGVAENVKCRVYSGSTYVTSLAKISWDNECEGFMGDGYAGEPLGTVLGTSLEGQVSQAVSEIGSVGVKASTVLSEIGSNYAKLSAGISGGSSEVGSTQTKLSTGISTATKAVSVGVQVSTALSEIGSNYAKISAGVSGGSSEVGSTQTKLSGAISLVASEVVSTYSKISAGVSGGSSEVGSTQTKLSAGISAMASELVSIYTIISTKLSVIDSQVS